VLLARNSANQYTSPCEN